MSTITITVCVVARPLCRKYYSLPRRLEILKSHKFTVKSTAPPADQETTMTHQRLRKKREENDKRLSTYELLVDNVDWISLDWPGVGLLKIPLKVSA